MESITGSSVGVLAQSHRVPFLYLALIESYFFGIGRTP